MPTFRSGTNYTHIFDYCKTSGSWLPVPDYWHPVTGGLVAGTNGGDPLDNLSGLDHIGSVHGHGFSGS